MKKDFKDALKKNSTFDGFAISQTEEEREAQKAVETSANAAAPHTATPNPTPEQIEEAEPDKPKKQRRISLYMDEGELLNNLDSYCQVHGISKNKLIVKIIAQYLTEERMQKVRQSLAALK